MDTYFEKILFIATLLIGKEIKKLSNNMEDTSTAGLVASCTSLVTLASIFNTLLFISVA